MEHSSSLITDNSIFVADNGGCIGCLIVGGGDTAFMGSPISARVFPGYVFGVLGHR